MAKDRDYWARWNHYQKYGTWPKSSAPKQQPKPTSVISTRQWAKENPELAAYDNDGNPIERGQ